MCKLHGWKYRWIELALLGILISLLQVLSFAETPSVSVTWQNYLKRQKAAVAKPAFDKALAQDPQNPELWWGLSVAEKSLGNYESAYQASLRALDQARYTERAELYLVRTYELSTNGKDIRQFTNLLEAMINDSEVSPYVRSLARWYLSHLYRQTGKIEDAKKQIRELGFVTDYRVLGPFDNEGKAGFNESYPPENEINYDTTYKGKLVDVQWFTPGAANHWGVIDFGGIFRPNEKACGYLLTYIESSVEQRVALRLGGSALKTWMNGKLVLKNPAIRQGKFDQEHIPVTLNKGWNQLLVKSGVIKGKWDIFARLSALDGSPVSQIRYSAEIPGEFENPLARSAVEKPDTTGLVKGIIRTLEMNCFQHPEDAMSWSELAYLYTQRNYHDENAQENVVAIESALAIYPQSIYFKKLYSDCQPDFNLRRLELESAYQSDSTDPELLNRLAQMDSMDNLSQKAMDKLQLAVKLNPVYASAWYNLGLENRRRGWQEEARLCFEKFIQYNPGMAEGPFQLANLPVADRSQSDKLKFLEQSVSLNHLFLPALDQWTDLQLVLGREEAFNQGIATKKVLNPFDMTPYLRVAILEYSRHQYRKVLEACDEGLKIAPLDSELLKYQGMAYQGIGELEASQKSWKRALLAKPNDTWLMDYLAYLAPDSDQYYQPYRINYTPEQFSLDSVDLTQSNSVTLLDQNVTKVFDDGNSSVYRHEIVKILTEDAVRALSTRSVGYSPNQQKLEVIKSRVIKPDGTIIEARDMGDSSASDVNSRLYYDYSVKQFSFPGLEKGAVIDFEYKLDDTQSNIYGEYFGDLQVIGGYDPTVKYEYVLLTPAKRKFNYFVDKVNPREPATELNTNGTIRSYRWQYENLPYIEREPMMPSYAETLPYIKISTFDTWDQLAKWYWHLIQDQFDSTGDIKEMVEKLTKDKKTNLEKVRAIYNFTVTDVRYLGLEFGIGGYKPHRAMDICRARYGDCKDKATLIITMLKEIGIPADIVLIRTKDLGDIDTSLPSLGLFNHAIAHVPDVDGMELWLDGTAMYTSLDEFPAGDQGRKVFCVNASRGTFKTTTAFTYLQSVANYTTQIILNADGSGTGSRITIPKGQFAPGMRYFFANSAKIKQEVEKQFNAQLPGTSVENIQHSDFTQLDTPPQLAFEFASPHVGVLAGNQMQLVGNLFPLRMVDSFARRSQRIHPVKFSLPLTRRIVTRYTLPPGFKINTLPKDLELEYPFGKISIKYTVDKNILNYAEEMQMRAWEIEAKDYPLFREWCNKIDRKEEEKIIISK